MLQADFNSLSTSATLPPIPACLTQEFVCESQSLQRSDSVGLATQSMPQSYS